MPSQLTAPATRRPFPWFLIVLLLAATLLRTLPLLDNRFHPDEALYGSFARRIASGQDPLLAGVLVDKPPLGFYLTALGFLVGGGGTSELGVRLPSLYASVVSVALLWALARRLYSTRTAYVAAGLLAASPFAILFSFTLFLDPLLAAAGLWSLAAGVRGRWRGMALALAVGFAIKQTALLIIPLALALALLPLPAHATPRAALHRLGRALRPLVPALLLTALVIFAWDAARQHPIGFWTQGYADNMPGRFVRANEVWPRARAWLALLHYGTASPALNLAALAGVAGLLMSEATSRSRAALADGALAGYLLLYVGAYWLLAFNVWDRYLVVVLPLLCLLAARGLLWLGAAVRRRLTAGAPARWAPPALATLAVVLLLPGTAAAVRSAYPIGGDHGAYDGVDDSAAYLRALPAGAVLYDFWLSWQWNFYLFDAPVYVAWLPSPEALATDLKAFGHTSPRYLAVPSWEQDGELRAAAESAGFEFVPRHHSYRRDGSLSLTVYELAPASTAEAGHAP